MALRFQPGEPIGEQAVRIAREQLRKALECQQGPAEDPAPAVHEIRQRIKKLRALLRLLRSENTPLRLEDEMLRDAARELACRRDADVARESLGWLCEEVPSLAQDPATALLQARLRAEVAATPPLAGSLERCRARLAAVERGLVDWNSGSPEADGLERRFRRDWRRARRRMRRALRKPSPERLHAWRKAVKAHYHQLRLLESLGSADLARQIPRCRRLQQLLGEHHDLARLAGWTADASIGPAPQLDPLLEAIERESHRRTGRSLRLGRSLFASRQAPRLFD